MAEFTSLGRCGIIIVCLVSLSIILIVALQAATLHLYRTENKKSQTYPDSSIRELPLQDYLRQTFPGRFFTDKEIEDFARSFTNQSSAALNVTLSREFTPICVHNYCRIVMAEIYTCCCKAQTGFISPPNAVDITGTTRTLAQFDDNRQYFYTETCTQISGDPGCKCVENLLLESAVYNVNVRLRKFGVNFFQLGNTCVGLNT